MRTRTLLLAAGFLCGCAGKREKVLKVEHYQPTKGVRSVSINVDRLDRPVAVRCSHTHRGEPSRYAIIPAHTAASVTVTVPDDHKWDGTHDPPFVRIQKGGTASSFSVWLPKQGGASTRCSSPSLADLNKGFAEVMLMEWTETDEHYGKGEVQKRFTVEIGYDKGGP